MKSNRRNFADLIPICAVMYGTAFGRLQVRQRFHKTEICPSSFPKRIIIENSPIYVYPFGARIDFHYIAWTQGYSLGLNCERLSRSGDRVNFAEGREVSEDKRLIVKWKVRDLHFPLWIYAPSGGLPEYFYKRLHGKFNTAIRIFGLRDITRENMEIWSQLPFLDILRNVRLGPGEDCGKECCDEGSNKDSSVDVVLANLDTFAAA
jgi:hypothetical protein